MCTLKTIPVFFVIFFLMQQTVSAQEYLTVKPMSKNNGYDYNILSSSAISPNMTAIYHVNCFKNYYDIAFNISNAIITNMTTTSNSYVTLSFSNSSQTGKIIAYIPKTFMNFHLSPNIHYNPLVISNQNYSPISYVNYSNSTHWIMSINIPHDVTQLTIESPIIPLGPGISAIESGTCSVVPEFGSLAVMIATVGIIGVILIQRRLIINIVN